MTIRYLSPMRMWNWRMFSQIKKPSSSVRARQLSPPQRATRTKKEPRKETSPLLLLLRPHHPRLQQSLHSENYEDSHYLVAEITLLRQTKTRRPFFFLPAHEYYAICTVMRWSATFCFFYPMLPTHQLVPAWHDDLNDSTTTRLFYFRVIFSSLRYP